MASTDPRIAASRAATLADRERVLRGAARVLELDPTGDPEIEEMRDRLYRMASGRRRMRHEILRRAGLLE